MKEFSDEQEASEIEMDVELNESSEMTDALLAAEAADTAENELSAQDVNLEGTELEGFESENIEEVEFIEDERLESIIESILFATDRPVSLNSIKLVFKGTNIRGDKIKRCLDRLAVEYAGSRRGISLEEAPGGYQLRTKIDNMEFLKRTLKTRTFRLSGAALEVLSIVAYKQPVIKNEVDQIRGVESGHLMRALMEKNLVQFEGKSDLPGRPMQYATTRKFLEIFGLRSIKELPTLSQIDELLPEGIDEEESKTKLSDITGGLSEAVGLGSYSAGEEELNKITEQLQDISTSSEFFEQEKIRQKRKRDDERAQNIRDAMIVGETVSTRDANWLKKYEDGSLYASDEVSQPSTPAAGAEAYPQELTAADEVALFEEEAPHVEDELPFLGEADELES